MSLGSWAAVECVGCSQACSDQEPPPAKLLAGCHAAGKVLAGCHTDLLAGKLLAGCHADLLAGQVLAGGPALPPGDPGCRHQPGHHLWQQTGEPHTLYVCLVASSGGLLPDKDLSESDRRRLIMRRGRALERAGGARNQH